MTIKTQTVTVARVPSIYTILKHAWGPPRGGWTALTDDQFILTWKWAMVADFLHRRNIDPTGYQHRAHHHILHQIRQNEIKAEFHRRGLGNKITLFIDIPLLNCTKGEKVNQYIKEKRT